MAKRILGGTALALLVLITWQVFHTVARSGDDEMYANALAAAALEGDTCVQSLEGLGPKLADCLTGRGAVTDEVLRVAEESAWTTTKLLTFSGRAAEHHMLECLGLAVPGERMQPRSGVRSCYRRAFAREELSVMAQRLDRPGPISALVRWLYSQWNALAHR